MSVVAAPMPEKFEISIPFNYRTHPEKQPGEFMVGALLQIVL